MTNKLGEAVRQSRLCVIISDFCAGDVRSNAPDTVEECARAWAGGERGPVSNRSNFEVHSVPSVMGGYLERLPLALIRHGLCDTAEIWSFWRHDQMPPFHQDSDFLTHRYFWADGSLSPYSSNDMLGHIAAFGAPDILCVWGLGVDEAIMRACATSFKIYNSIDAPALRVPPEISRHFDLVLTGARWQSDAVVDRHRDMATLVLPIGPDFASPETFFPMQLVKTYDVIYVAAAQPYKRHDILFAALAKMPRTVRALCVSGYGELGDSLRTQAHDLRIDVDFIGPPGVGFAEVNRLMNLARIGVVCGVDDGAPAIITEYMLAGLPVLANAELRCGLQYIVSGTGRMAMAETFHEVLAEMLKSLDTFKPREIAVANWSWPSSVAKLAAKMTQVTGG